MSKASKWAIGALAAAVAVAGLITVGTPENARQDSRDNKRILDLRRLEAAVHCRAGGGLPERIEPRHELCPDLPDDLSDPLTAAAYDYEVTGARSFRLCATAERPQTLRRRMSDLQIEGNRVCLPATLSEGAVEG